MYGCAVGEVRSIKWKSRCYLSLSDSHSKDWVLEGGSNKRFEFYNIWVTLLSPQAQ